MLYISKLLGNMYNSYNLNVLLKSCKLTNLLILKFGKSLNIYIKYFKDELLKTLVNKKAVYLSEVSKTFYYLSKY